MSLLGLKGQNDHEKFYNWIFGLFLVIILIVIYIVGDIIYHCNIDVKCFTEINGIITSLMTVIGIFIAFTAINIYSIFNSRVDEEKEKLNELLSEYEIRINSIDKDKIFNLQNELKIMLSINNIITDYISTTDKGTAIGVLLEEIEHLEWEAENSDSFNQRSEFEGKLKVRVKTIYIALDGYYKNPKQEINKNHIYKQMLDNLMNKLNVIMTKYDMNIKKEVESESLVNDNNESSASCPPGSEASGDSDANKS